MQDWQPDGALVSEEMGEVCRQKPVGCPAERAGETEPDALPVEATEAMPGGRHLHRVDPWSRTEASLVLMLKTCSERARVSAKSVTDPW